MDAYTVIILLTLIGFFALAALLLTPLYFFLNREEERGEAWTRAARAERAKERPPGGNGRDEAAETPRPEA